MAYIVPPGGFAGFSQMTPASRAALSRGGASRGSSSRRRRRKSGRVKAKRGRSAKRRASGRKMKFGSPAWQRKYRVGKFAKGRKRRRRA